MLQSHPDPGWPSWPKKPVLIQFRQGRETGHVGFFRSDLCFHCQQFIPKGYSHCSKECAAITASIATGCVIFFQWVIQIHIAALADQG